MGMLIARRLAFMVFVLWGITLVTFFLSRVVPGDPARLLAGPQASPVEVAHIARIYGLDDSLIVQYGRYLRNLLHGDLGFSFVTRRDVRTDIATFLPATIELAGYALVTGFVLAVVAGTVAAYRRGTGADAAGRLTAIAGLSLPVFWLALLLQLLFHTELGWLPLGGRLDPGATPPPHITGLLTVDSLLTGNFATFVNAAEHLVLPVVVLAAGVYGLMVRIMRTSVLDSLGEECVRTAEAKGLSRWRVLRRHVLRNAMLPAVTVLGLEFGLLAAGVFVVESVFQWPGLGNYAFQAIQANDYNATLGATFVIAVLYVVINLIVDIAYLYLDPQDPVRVIGQSTAEQGRLARGAAGRLRRGSGAVGPFLAESRLNAAGVAIVALVLLLAVFGPLIAPQNPNQIDLLAVLQPPSVHYWFGTDNLGRDLFSRVLAGTRISVEVAVIILSLSVTFGTALGIVSGLAGGLVDEIVMRVTDLFLAFPGFILAAAIAATLGPSLPHTVLALAVVFWPWYTRLIRGQVLSLREREFVLAARVARAGTVWIATRHLARNVLAILVVQVSLDVGYAILATSSLSFLGLGAQPPSPEWGAIIAEGRSYIQTAWWWSTFAGIALALTVLGFNLLGDGLRDWIDPRLRGSIGGLQE